MEASGCQFFDFSVSVLTRGTKNGDHIRKRLAGEAGDRWYGDRWTIFDVQIIQSGYANTGTKLKLHRYHHSVYSDQSGH